MTARYLGLNGELVEPGVMPRVAGVGLIRGEYLCRVLGNYITCEKVRDGIRNYIATLGESTKNKEIWYRLIDMESSEVNTFEGCDMPLYEKSPMMGLRGAGRALRISGTFDLEVAMLIECAKENHNVHVIIPYVTSVVQFETLAARMRELGFPNKIGVMIETPAMALDLAEFISAQLFVVGLNDLRSLCLGIARDRLAADAIPGSVMTLLKHCMTTASSKNIPLRVAGYIGADSFKQLELAGVEAVVVHYSHLNKVFPYDFEPLVGELDYKKIKNEVRARVGDPIIR
ncbi:putative PEP-binding protein [Pseudomonas brassicacearum]|uniref:putative PEP-binding protein n=1 Tax=Pseudomonas brassicacearum TaxID=930166 RepID=UPI001DEE4853|nr:putative PEP-binding protein [Pseudomonas brassicacearum]CAH0305608.1 Phosphoenolpyruvate synthase [Pseudomonas brassicacearum]